MLRRPRKRLKGFTLIELMIVIAIVAILAAILVPNLIRARSRGQLTACTSNLRNIGTAVEMYNVDASGRYPPSLDVLTPSYLKTVPSCPTAGVDTYSGSYTFTVLPDAFEVFCQGSFHSGFTDVNYPRFTAAQGLIERP